MVEEALRVESIPVVIAGEHPARRWGAFLAFSAVFLVYALIAMLTIFR
jgi:hypothetical protein